jgi:dehydrogenase/reductase SDR family protein 1
MTKNREGLIINVSSIGGMMYLFNVPYGVGKAACDRMAGKGIIFHFLIHR